jgi:molybdopterin/thiamine biosynthesis adenylyltransferase
VAVVDGGVVQHADLFGQSVLCTPDVGSNRAEAVAARLGVLNPHTHADSYPVDVEEANAPAILVGHDVAVDCRSGLSLERACRATGVTLVAGGGDRAIDGLRAADEALATLAAPAPVSEGAPA